MSCRPRALSTLAAVCAFVPAAFGATAPAGTAAAPGSSESQMRAVVSSASVDSSNRAPTPAEYKAMQEGAPEALVLHIISVKTQTAASGDPNAISGAALAVAARAAVLGVTRTATDLKVGSVITLYYGYVPLKPVADGSPPPPPVPIVKENTDYSAYLTGGGGDNPYRAAAGGQSFLDPKASANATGPIAEPTLLPSPTNPRPAGALRLTGAGLESFVKLVQIDGHWAVSIVNSEPIPLQVMGDATPTLLYYYGKPAVAPYTQPLVVVYRAGTQAPTPPDIRVLSIERALILDNDRHLLADVLWAPRAPDDGLPPPALAAWTWFSYKLEIADPDTKKVQTVILSGKPPPTPDAAPAASGARR